MTRFARCWKARMALEDASTCRLSLIPVLEGAKTMTWTTRSVSLGIPDWQRADTVEEK